jgi:hypothetical protein
MYWLLFILPGGPTLAYLALRGHKAKSGRPLMRLSSLIVVLQLVMFVYFVVLIAPPGFVHRDSYWIAATIIWTVIVMRIINSATDFLRKKGVAVRIWLVRLVQFIHGVIATILEIFCILPLSKRISLMFPDVLVTLLIIIAAGILVWRFASLAKEAQDPNEVKHLWVAGGALLAGLYLFSVISFARTIYPFVPAERGGGDYSESPIVTIMPISAVLPDYLDTEFEIARLPNREVSPIEQTAVTMSANREVRLIEQTSSWIYVARVRETDRPRQSPLRSTRCGSNR